MQWCVDLIPNFDWQRYGVITVVKSGDTIEISKENSHIGLKSIHLNRNETQSPEVISYYRFHCSIDESDIGKTAYFNWDTFSDNTINCTLSFFNSHGQIDIIALNAPGTNNSWSQVFSLSKIIPEDCETIDCRVQIGKNIAKVNAFVDNFKVIIQ